MSHDLLMEHVERHEHEAACERFADLPPGALSCIYSQTNLAKPVGARLWCRVWTVERDGKVVAHASAYDLGEGDIVFGHIGVERAYRGERLARLLQDQRAAFLDEHQLTLIGAVAPGNQASLRGCLRSGFKVSNTQPDGSIWVYREPQARVDSEGVG